MYKVVKVFPSSKNTLRGTTSLWRRTLRNHERQTQLEPVTLPRISRVTGQAGLGTTHTFHRTIPTPFPKA
jgi:hypothetical protein